jgi:hypothetical protein
MFGGNEQRKNRRFPSIARAKIPGVLTGDALLKDISVTGCRMEFTMQPDISVGQRYTINIIPEKKSKIGSFELVTECKWIHARDYSCDIGFDVVESPKGRAFQRYVDYLSWRIDAQT